ncbi:hypothetical protein NMG60_11005447 [Bertholletia excelsa]
MALHLCLSCSILLIWCAGSTLSAIITLDSIEIFRTHELLVSKPTIYFQCKGENKTVLPDVKEANVSYTFKAEESWQPLTEFQNKKCKRCGFYQEGILHSSDFDEWELCPSDFTGSDGSYSHLKDKELKATFLCSECQPFGSDSNDAKEVHNGAEGMHLAIVIAISVGVSTAFVVGLAVAYKYWRKRKRQQEQARFLKLFEEGDDIEDELDVGPLSGV